MCSVFSKPVQLCLRMLSGSFVCAAQALQPQVNKIGPMAVPRPSPHGNYNEIVAAPAFAASGPMPVAAPPASLDALSSGCLDSPVRACSLAQRHRLRNARPAGPLEGTVRFLCLPTVHPSELQTRTTPSATWHLPDAGADQAQVCKEEGGCPTATAGCRHHEIAAVGCCALCTCIAAQCCGSAGGGATAAAQRGSRQSSGGCNG